MQRSLSLMFHHQRAPSFQVASSLFSSYAREAAPVAPCPRTIQQSTGPASSSSSSDCSPPLSSLISRISSSFGCSSSNSSTRSLATAAAQGVPSPQSPASSIGLTTSNSSASSGSSSNSGQVRSPSDASKGKGKRAPPPSIMPAPHITVSAFPPLHPTGPLTVQYPFPIEYYSDREVVVRNFSNGLPQGLEVLPGSVFNVPVSCGWV